MHLVRLLRPEFFLKCLVPSQLTLSRGTGVSPFSPGYRWLLVGLGTQCSSQCLWGKVVQMIHISVTVIHCPRLPVWPFVSPELFRPYCSVFYLFFPWTNLLIFSFLLIFFFISLLNPIHPQAHKWLFLLPLDINWNLILLETQCPWTYLKWKLFSPYWWIKSLVVIFLLPYYHLQIIHFSMHMKPNRTNET